MGFKMVKMVNTLTYLVLGLMCLYTEAQISPLITWRPGSCPDLKYRCTWLDCYLWCMSLQYQSGSCMPIIVPCNIFMSVRHNQCMCYGPPAISTDVPATKENSAAPATSTRQPASQTSTPPGHSTPQSTEIERTLTPDPRVLLGSTTQSSVPQSTEIVGTLTSDPTVLLGSTTQSSVPQSTEIERALTSDPTVLLGSTTQSSVPQSTEIERALTSDPRVLLGSTAQSSMPVLITSGLQLLSTPLVTQAEVETSTIVPSVIQGTVGTYSTTTAPVQSTPALQTSLP
ncbi:hypothetical protein BsWGS_21869 [Bradybaena similaris]